VSQTQWAMVKHLSPHRRVGAPFRCGRPGRVPLVLAGTWAALGLLNNNDNLFIFAAGKIDKTRLARLTKPRRVARACQSR